MELSRFLNGIHLMPEAIDKLENLRITREQYEEVRNCFYADRKEFYRRICQKEEAHILFLYYFCRFACETYERYVARGIEDSVYWDTFYDITLWCENCYRDYGEYGIAEYDWLYRHIEMSLFRFGRLQFEKTFAEPGWDVAQGREVISIHIPQGENLDRKACLESVRRGRQFWGTEYTYLCDSWVLEPELQKILKEGSNILQFQKLFDIMSVDKTCRQAEERIFIRLQENPADYPEKTSLQKAARKYLMAGGKLGCGVGRLKLEEWKTKE